MKRLFILCTIFLNFPIMASTQSMVIITPIASVRISPIDYSPMQEPDEKKSKEMFGRSFPLFQHYLQPKYRDPWQDSQLLFNEQVRCLQHCSKGWLKIELMEQYAYNNRTQSYEHIIGYIKSDQVKPIIVANKPTHVVNTSWADLMLADGTQIKVPMGTKLCCTGSKASICSVQLADGRTASISTENLYDFSKQLAVDELRSLIVINAQRLLGGSYCWGGRTPQADQELTGAGCDCSGLVNMVYRAAGIEVPRNSHAQWLQCKKIDQGSYLKPGDLIFFAFPNRPDKVHHVLLYIGNEELIESCSALGIALRKTQERLSKPVATITYGDIIKISDSSTEYVVYFGSFLNDTRCMKFMHDYACGNYDINKIGTE